MHSSMVVIIVNRIFIHFSNIDFINRAGSAHVFTPEAQRGVQDSFSFVVFQATMINAPTTEENSEYLLQV